MKITKILSSILLVFFVFALTQCVKESIEIKNNKQLDLRSSIEVGGEVVSPTCGIGDLLGVLNTNCSFDGTITKTIQASNGCNIDVTMDVYLCYPPSSPDENFVDFRNFKWKLTPPVSSQCSQWWLQLMTQNTATKNVALDNFITEMEDKFIDLYMRNFVVTEGIYCDLDETHSSAILFKSPCYQRCVTPPSPDEITGFFAYDKPCADDGCCVKTYNYCVKRKTGEIFQSGGIQLVRPCTNFINVVCAKNTVPWGECRDHLCN